MADSKRSTIKVVAAQATPVFLDRDATVEKACGLIAEAGRMGAQLIAFPEAFIPTYPDWVWAVPAGEDGVLQALYSELIDNSVTVPSPATERLCQAARRAHVFVVMGMSERDDAASGASLYNSLLYVNAQGRIVGLHRKLVPTGGERLVWAQGDGSTLDAYDTPFGKLSGLICWENYMPLARYALYAWGTRIYVAATWDRDDAWLATIRHIACEGRAFVISACMALRKDDIPDRYEFKRRFYSHVGEWINVGRSAIVGPTGQFLAGPVEMKEELVCAEIDVRHAEGHKWMLDVAGHYGRPDVFQLTVNRHPRPMIRTQDAPESQDAGTTEGTK